MDHLKAPKFNNTNPPITITNGNNEHMSSVYHINNNNVTASSNSVNGFDDTNDDVLL